MLPAPSRQPSPEATNSFHSLGEVYSLRPRCGSQGTAEANNQGTVKGTRLERVALDTIRDLDALPGWRVSRGNGARELELAAGLTPTMGDSEPSSGKRRTVNSTPARFETRAGAFPEAFLRAMAEEDRRAIGQMTASEAERVFERGQEKELKRHVVNWLNSQGCWIFTQGMHRKTGGQRGTPDLIVITRLADGCLIRLCEWTRRAKKAGIESGTL